MYIELKNALDFRVDVCVCFYRNNIIQHRLKFRLGLTRFKKTTLMSFELAFSNSISKKPKDKTKSQTVKKNTRNHIPKKHEELWFPPSQVDEKH